MKTSLLTKIVTFLDSYALLIVTGFLLAFIPLYPKIPFFSPIEQYNVRVRLEDFFVVFAVLLWAWQWLRQKTKLQPIATGFVASYAVVGLLSVASAVFIIQTVPLIPMHLGKTLLHYFRYLEYFSLFFVTYAAITRKKDLKILLGVFAATVLAITIYGYGQKYLYWPVYSTMNREFSKGITLYLTEHARVQSTFAGHYDLGAYLVVALPLLLSLSFWVKNTKLKTALHLIHLGGAWLLVVTASRTSFLAYLLALGIVLALKATTKPTWQSALTWFMSRSFVIGTLVSVIMIAFGQDMYDRLLQVIEGYPKLHASYTQLINTPFPKANLLSQLGIEIKKPTNGLSTDEAERIIVNSDQRPVKTKPSDVYVDVPDFVEVQVATISASGSATTIKKIEERERVFSECAKQKGLSLCIRLETLWPQAIAGFVRNPLFGNGYATLSKADINDFEEIDGTDNNFLRTLGETGLLGFLTFYGFIVVSLVIAYRGFRSSDTLTQTIAIGYLAGGLGLLLNAYYIDVYAASKVAFNYWMLTGMLYAAVRLAEQKNTKTL